MSPFPGRMIEMHGSSLDKMLAFRKEYLDGREGETLLILDLGSLDVNGAYREYFDVSSWRYTGVDLSPGKNVDIVLQDPYTWREIKADSVDVVISGQALEHIELFWLTMLEIGRVLKPGGLCCIIAPSGGPEHRYPVDCYRFFPDGLAALARFGSLEVLEVYSQDGPTGYDDGSDMWRDTVVVCRKPLTTGLVSMKRWLKNRLLHRLLRPPSSHSRSF